MNRRLFASSLAASGIALTTGFRATDAMAVIQTPNASPESRQDDGKIPLSRQPGFILGVSRTFVVPEPGIDDLTRGILLNLQGSGIEFDTPGNASAALTFLGTAIPAYYTETTDDVIDSVVVDERIGNLGDERTAQTLTLSFDRDAFDQFEFGIVLVRKDANLQFLTGFSTKRATEQVIELVEALDDRWPTDDLWDIVPTTQDVPRTMTHAGEEVTEPSN
jgi:hypothetical protein